MRAPDRLCGEGDAFLPRVFGPVPDELFASTAFPEGGDPSVGVAGEAMRVLAQASADLPSGSRSIIRGHVIGRHENLLVAAPITWPALTRTAPLLHEASLKIRVTRCGFPGGIIFDAHSQLVFEGGCGIDVELLGPPEWRLLGQLPGAETPLDVHEVDVRIIACPCSCGPTAPATLTWWAEPADGDAFVVPRRATSLVFNTPGPAGMAFAWWDGDPAVGGSVQLGSIFNVNGGFINADVRPGAASHLQVVNGAGAGTPVVFVWNVES